jgi:hypothetical protein
MTYEYLIIRYVHNVSTEEFVNIGILLWAPQERRMYHQISERYSRLSMFFDGFNGYGYRAMIRNLKGKCRSVEKNERLFRNVNNVDDIAELIFSKNSSCFQWSEAISGITDDPALRVKAVFSDIVERHYDKQERRRRSENDIYRDVHKLLFERLKKRGLQRRVQRDVEVLGEHFGHKFKLGWQNGTRQFLEPISFDYTHGAELIDKAYVWSGRLADLGRNKDFKLTGIVAPPQEKELLRHYEEALAILRESQVVRHLIPEDQFEQALPEIEREVAEAL